MKELDRSLYQSIGQLVDKTQEFVDSEYAKAISIFSSKTEDNNKWLNDISSNYTMEDEKTLATFRELKQEHIMKLDELEERINYYEKLYEEINEITDEFIVKTKIQKNRQSRIVGS